MKKKKFLSCIAVVLALLTQFSVIAPFPAAAAAISSFQFITGASLTDGNGNPLPAGNIPKNSTVRVNYQFKIPNNTTVQAGDTYSMQIPQQIEITDALAAQTIPLNDGNGQTVANATIDKAARTVTLTFTDYASKHSDVSGNFYFQTSFDESQIGNSNPIQIPFDIGCGTTVNIPVNFTQPDVTVQKSGTYDVSSNTITWKAVVNQEGVTVNNAVFTDNIKTGQQYVPGSLSITDGQGAPLTTSDGANYQASGDSGKTGTITYDFGQKITQTYTVTFKTTVTDPAVFTASGSVNEYNQAILNHDGTSTPSNNASVPVTVNLIAKTGVYNANTKNIDWTITVNGDKQDLSNATVTDVIPDGLDLVTSDPGNPVKVDGGTVSLGSNPGNYQYTGKTFTYAFGNIGKTTHTISFSTSISDPNYFRSNPTSTSFTNKATLTATSGGSPVNITTPGTTVGVPSSVISKAGGYNAGTQKITWTVTINANKVSITNPRIEDDIPAGQQYLDGTVQVKNSAGADVTSAAGTVSYAPADSGDLTKGGTLTYTFNSGTTITDQYTLTFQTLVTNPADTATNKSTPYTNKATLRGDDIGTVTANASTNVNSQVIDKSGAGYDYASRQLSWKIIVNQNKMSLPSAVITDGVPKGQDYVDGSLQVKDSAGNDVTATAGTVSYVRNTAGDPASGGTLTYTFGGTISDQYTVTLKTKVTDLSVFSQNGTLPFGNKATLTDSFGPPVSDSATINVTNTVVGKNAAYQGGNDYIDWSVTINSNAVPMTSGSLTDMLQAGLDLDTSTVALYPLTVNAGGGFTRGTAVPLTAGNVSYNRSTRTFIFTMPADTQSAYLLTFRTYITDKTITSVTNDISFSGLGTTQGSSKTVNGIAVSSAGGSAGGATGSITVTKVDADNPSQKLPGAAFELLDSYGNAVSDPVTTGTGGTALFSGLRYGTYTVKETKAPDDYQLVDTPYTCTISSSQQDISYNYTDPKMTGTIRVVKTDGRGMQLSGAEFTLYDGTGKAVRTAVSGADGIAEFAKVDLGDYTIRETAAPAAYLLSDQVISVSVTSDNYATARLIDFSDQKAGIISITKVDADDAAKTLTGAEFELLDQSGSIVSGPQAVGADGTVVFTGLKYGTYSVKETKAPDGYQLSRQPYTCTVGSGQTTVSYHFPDSRMEGTAQVTKTDEQGNPLAGAQFTLYDANGKTLQSAVSGADGIARFTKIPLGDYTIKETAAPAGYRLSDRVLSVSVTEANYMDTQKFTFVDPKSLLIDDGQSPTGSATPVENPKTGGGSAIPFVQTGLLALLSGGAAAAGKLKARSRKKK